MAVFELQGLAELERMVNELGQVPRKVTRSAARAGAQLDLTAVRRASPVGSTGNLKASLTKKQERSSNPGKAVFDITFDKTYNISLVKHVKNPGKYGGKSDRAYYPAAQEYGFMHSGPKGYVPGYHFMQKASNENEAAIEQAIINKAFDAIDKILESG